MPVNQKKMRALKAQYGAKKGEELYYRMESKAKKRKAKSRKK